YDAAGRVIRRTVTRISRTPDTWHHTWDAHDRLTKTVTPDGTVWTYLYDPFGRRIAKHRHHTGGRLAETVRFTWHDTTLIEEHHTTHDSTGPDTVTTWDHTGLHPLTQTTRRMDGDAGAGDDLAKADQGEIDHRFAAIVTDLVGTPTHLTDPDTGHTTSLVTTLWGHTPGTAPTPLRFPGQYADPETGWHYNLHRHYDPTPARYTTPPPLAPAPAPNPHTYPHNPTTWTDPLGLSAYQPSSQPEKNKVLPSRSAAFREAKRDLGIPTGQQPNEIRKIPMEDRSGRKLKNPDGTIVQTREYVFERKRGDRVIIQDHSAGHRFGEGGVGDQGPHFNVRPFDNPRTGKVPGTAQHYEY
ncbi:HNH/endonuclease VII fold putative polymorphic toxin, partial [Streptomyces sp. ST2-7A]|uniref:HNH/endonuclease VII fold putative polymorphic toxin n=1 Tax=Streptomyces sp. ST2-7A TaxID=2907214 RepID=UPI002277A66A